MSRRALSWIIGFACLVSLGHVAPALAVSEAQVDEFMRKSGLWQQLAEIEPGVQQGIAQNDAELRQLNEEQIERLRDAGRAAYGVDRLRRAMRMELVRSLPPAETERALKFLNTDLGKRVTALEEAAASKENAERIESIADDALAALELPRRDLIERMVKATRIAEVAASIMINQQLGIMRGIAVYAGHGDFGPEADQEDRLNRYRAQLVAAFGRRMTAQSAVIYGPLPDSDLAAYVDFLESPAGQETNNAVSAALDKVLGAAAFELGRRIGDALKPGDPTSTRT